MFVLLRHEHGRIAGSTGKVRSWIQILILLLSNRMTLSVTSSAQTWCPLLIMEVIKPRMVVSNEVR